MEKHSNHTADICLAFLAMHVLKKFDVINVRNMHLYAASQRRYVPTRKLSTGATSYFELPQAVIMQYTQELYRDAYLG
jgi:hypothetical protein